MTAVKREHYRYYLKTLTNCRLGMLEESIIDEINREQSKGIDIAELALKGAMIDEELSFRGARVHDSNYHPI